MTLRLERPLAAFDIESTGVDTERDRIVEIAIVIITPDGERSSRCRRLNPGIPIPPVASAVHGIRDEDVADCPPFGRIAASLDELLRPCDLTGYNVRAFDVPLLAAEFARCRIKWPRDGVVVVDSHEIFRAREPMTLERALKYYMGKTLGDDAHGAEADANAALDVLIGQSCDYKPPNPGPWSLEDIARLQRRDDWIDETGKAKMVGDIPVINFGKWQGTPMDQVDPDYFKWILGNDFPEDFKALCRERLQSAGKGADQ